MKMDQKFIAVCSDAQLFGSLLLQDMECWNVVRYNPKTLLAVRLYVDNQPFAPMKKQTGQRNWTDERKRHLESIRTLENESLWYKEL